MCPVSTSLLVLETSYIVRIDVSLSISLCLRCFEIVLQIIIVVALKYFQTVELNIYLRLNVLVLF